MPSKRERTLSYEDVSRAPARDKSSSSGGRSPRPRSNTYDGSPTKEAQYDAKKAISVALHSLKRVSNATPQLDAAAIAEAFLTINPPMPLRMRAGSEIAPLRGMVPLRHKADNRADAVESADNWRDRIWPTKAVYSFCRAITRCQPPLGMVPGARLGLKDSKRAAGTGCYLGPHWSPNSLQKIPLTFDTAAAHASAFFLHLVEECRESATAQETGDAAVEARGSNGWCMGEVVSVLGETEKDKLPHRGDPRIGSVWVLRLRLSAFTAMDGGAVSPLPPGPGEKTEPAPLEPPAAPPPSSSSSSSNNTHIPEIAGGDLLLLQHPRWERPVLAVAQGWDPDYDLKFGSLKSEACGDGRDLVNVLVCVDHGTPGGAPSSGRDGDIGGWVQQGVMTVGQRFHLVALGNVMTSMRECQALLSLKALNRPLQRVIVRGGAAAGGGGEGAAAAAAAASVGPSLPASSAALAAAPLSQLRPEVSPFSPPPPPPKPSCPDSLPPPLWEALKANYNPSQLRAIRAVCHGESPEEAVFSLLQGPPGTGKTRTILAIIAALLAGGAAKPRSSTKVLVGSSLRHQAPQLAAVSGGAHGKERIRVLVCAPSNTAVDEIVYRLKTQGVLGTDGACPAASPPFRSSSPFFLISPARSPHLLSPPSRPAEGRPAGGAHRPGRGQRPQLERRGLLRGWLPLPVAGDARR